MRRSGSYRLVEVSEFDLVPCRMRLSMPGKSRLVHPVPGRPNGVDYNVDVLVWCECMAQTWDQLDYARRVAAGESMDRDWPRPKQTRNWDVLGAVRTVLVDEAPYAASTRGRPSNPTATAEAVSMWEQHVAERKARIERRNQ